MTGQFLLGGVVNATGVAVVALLLSRLVGEIYGRALIAVILTVAGGTYVGFAVVGAPGTWWPLLETVQAIVIGALALLGMRGSPYWLAAAWAVHPLWDVLVHYLGAGHAFAPEAWAVSCVSFDLLLAAYVVVAAGYGRGQPARDRNRRTTSWAPRARVTS